MKTLRPLHCISRLEDRLRPDWPFRPFHRCGPQLPMVLSARNNPPAFLPRTDFRLCGKGKRPAHRGVTRKCPRPRNRHSPNNPSSPCYGCHSIQDCLAQRHIPPSKPHCLLVLQCLSFPCPLPPVQYRQSNRLRLSRYKENHIFSGNTSGVCMSKA